MSITAFTILLNGAPSAYSNDAEAPPLEARQLAAVAAFRKHAADSAAAAEKDGKMSVPAADGWLFLANELRMLGLEGEFWGHNAAKSSRATRPEWADPLPAILDFKAQLQRAGIELIVIPVPAKATVYADKTIAHTAPQEAELLKPPPGLAGNENNLARWNGRTDATVQAFLRLLQAEGISTIDLAPALLAARHNDAQAGPVYCLTDTHWSSRGAAVAAQAIARQLKDRPWLKNSAKLTPATELRKIEITGDLARENAADAVPPKETLELRFAGIRSDDGKLEPIAIDRTSPVLVLGDSHALVFHDGGDMHARGAGLPDQLAVEFGFAVDVEAVRGSGATPARINLMRRVRADADTLKTKKVVLWIFAVREFTESSGWRNVPVVP